MKKWVLILMIIAGARYFAGEQGPHSGSWQKVGEQDFARRVLQAELPALVYFDTAIGCRDADSVFTTLSRQTQGVLAVFYVNAVAHPQLARTYGVDTHVVFVLFHQGRVIKRATAREVLQSVTAKNGGFYTQEGFLREMEVFANLR